MPVKATFQPAPNLPRNPNQVTSQLNPLSLLLNRQMKNHRNEVAQNHNHHPSLWNLTLQRSSRHRM